MATRLLVKNFPAKFTDVDKKEFLSLFGAQDVVCMSNFGKLRNACFVSFDTPTNTKQALEVLHQCDLLGQPLVAEYAKAQHEQSANQIQSKMILEDQSKDVTKKQTQEENSQSDEAEFDDGICPQLGVNHNFPNNLHYKYPEPNVTILTNIANALATVPKFYVQVLHLMNKMNLPPPFSVSTATPPVSGDSVNMHDACTDTIDLQAFSDESELESDSESTKQAEIYKDSQLLSGPLRKRKRLKALPLKDQEKLNITKSKSSNPIENTFELASSTKRFEFKLASSIQDMVEGKQEPQVSYNVFDERGEFGKIEPQQKPVESNELVSSSSEDEIGVERTYISLLQLKENQISKCEVLAMAQFKNYTEGDISNRLYVKNIAKTVQDSDLLFIFNRFIKNCSKIEKEMLNIRLMQEGRMKGQAFITFPSEKIAEKALKLTHGYVLQGKPMVIQFARAGKKD